MQWITKWVSYMQWVLILSIPFGFIACKPTQIMVKTPLQTTETIPTQNPQLSYINIPISVSAKSLEDKLNQELKGVLYEDDNFDEDNYTLKVSKTSPIRVFTSEDYFYYSIPLKINAKGVWKWQPISAVPAIKKEAATEFDMKVNCRTSVALSKDWKVLTNTKIEYEWGQKPKIDLGPVSIPISFVLEPILNRKLDDISEMLDKEVAKRLELKPILADFWQQIQTPFLMDKENSVWLSLEPKSVEMTPLSLKNNNIGLEIAMQTMVKTAIGEKPNTVVNKNLPPLFVNPKLKQGFGINLHAVVDYSYANKLVKNQLEGKDFSFNKGKQYIKILSTDILGSEKRITSKIGIEGYTKILCFKKKIKGVLVAQGLPIYNKETQTIEVKDFNWNFETRDVLVKTAKWIMQSNLKEMIATYLKFPLKDKIDMAKKMIQEGVDKNNINEQYQINLSLNEIAPEGIFLTDKGIVAILNGSGKVNLIIKKF